jgi:hypothetical protein
VENINVASLEKKMAIKKKLKIIVYSCITGDYVNSIIKQPNIHNNYINKNFEYLFFTDNKIAIGEPWKKREIDGLNGFGSKDKNRFIKINPHIFLPEHDISIYIDGDIQINSDLNELLQTIISSDGSIFLYEHYLRDCIYDEANACANDSLELIWRIASQMRRYKSESFPRKLGLYEGNIIIRKNNIHTIKLMEAWWHEYYFGAKRDQLSLTYCSWKNGIPINSMGNGNIRVKGGEFYLDMSERKRRFTPKFLIVKAMNDSIKNYKLIFLLVGFLYYIRYL